MELSLVRYWIYNCPVYDVNCLIGWRLSENILMAIYICLRFYSCYATFKYRYIYGDYLIMDARNRLITCNQEPILINSSKSRNLWIFSNNTYHNISLFSLLLPNWYKVILHKTIRLREWTQHFIIPNITKNNTRWLDHNHEHSVGYNVQPINNYTLIFVPAYNLVQSGTLDSGIMAAGRDKVEHRHLWDCFTLVLWWVCCCFWLVQSSIPMDSIKYSCTRAA